MNQKNIDAYIPNFGRYKPDREGFIFNKELNQYECIKEGSNKAILLFKGERTIAKATPKTAIEVVSAIAKTVHYESNAVEKALSIKR